MKEEKNKVNLSSLLKITRRKKKRVGQGYGSGKGGHTSGRGAKGFKARGKVTLTFAGTKVKKSFVKRLPFYRGKGGSKSSKLKPMIVNIKQLNLLPRGAVVNLDLLIKEKIVNEEEAKKSKIKILGGGKLNIPLKVELPCSKGAVKQIEKAGGKVIGAKYK